MFAGRLASVFAEDLTAILGGGEADRGGDVFELAIGGAKQFGGDLDAMALQPVVRAHAGLLFEDRKEPGPTASSLFREVIHRHWLHVMMLQVVDGVVRNAGRARGLGAVIAARGGDDD